MSEYSHVRPMGVAWVRFASGDLRQGSTRSLEATAFLAIAAYGKEIQACAGSHGVQLVKTH